MNTINIQKVNNSAKKLESVIKQAKRRLFEFETMISLYEFQSGKAKKYASVASLFRDVKKHV